MGASKGSRTDMATDEEMTMASKKTKPHIRPIADGPSLPVHWEVLGSGQYRYYRDYDTALAEFERQVELYRRPESSFWDDVERIAEDQRKLSKELRQLSGVSKQPFNKPERKRLLAWMSPAGGYIRVLPEGTSPQVDTAGWRRAPWLDEREDDDE